MKITAWSVAASVFCSSVLLNAAYDAGKGPILAAIGASAKVERGLADMAVRMGLPDAPEAVVAEVEGAPAEDQAFGKPTPELEPVAKWVLADGDGVNMSGVMGQKLGLTNGAKFWGIQKGVQNDEGTFYVTVSTQPTKTAIVIMNYLKSDEVQLILTSPEGIFEKGYAGKKGGHFNSVTQSEIEAAFVSSKKRWIEMAAAKTRIGG